MSLEDELDKYLEDFKLAVVDNQCCWKNLFSNKVLISDKKSIRLASPAYPLAFTAPSPSIEIVFFSATLDFYCSVFDKIKMINT